MSCGRVLVAMSGGVDSSVTALLLMRAGYRCEGVTMRLSAPNDADVADARATCQALGIPHHTVSFAEAFEREVVRPYVDAYAAGLTPNPCCVCNPRIKFGLLLDHALDLGFDWLATGHYARIARRVGTGAGETAAEGAGFAAEGAAQLAEGAAQAAEGSAWRGMARPTDGGANIRLLKGVDPEKDQSYFLYALTAGRLAHVLFPLGGLIKKAQVRAIAQEAGLAAVRRRESYEVCFVPDHDHLGFVERRLGRPSEPGNILDVRGRPIGRHEGALRYTMGQRKGLGVAAARPLYVCGRNLDANTVTVGDESLLMADSATACNCSWVAGRPPAPGPFWAAAKLRYRQEDQPCLVTPLAHGRMRLDFDEPQRAITPGQAVVVYEGETVLGGGSIEAEPPSS